MITIHDRLEIRSTFMTFNKLLNIGMLCYFGDVLRQTFRRFDRITCDRDNQFSLTRHREI